MTQPSKEEGVKTHRDNKKNYNERLSDQHKEARTNLSAEKKSPYAPKQASGNRWRPKM